jgi:hypothetical protein
VCLVGGGHPLRAWHRAAWMPSSGASPWERGFPGPKGGRGSLFSKPNSIPEASGPSNFECLLLSASPPISLRSFPKTSIFHICPF